MKNYDFTLKFQKFTSKGTFINYVVQQKVKKSSLHKVFDLNFLKCLFPSVKFDLI